MSLLLPNVFLIYATCENGVIGKDGGIPWRSPQDFQWFKRTTVLSTVIMGRKTWESLPHGALPNRDNYVISRNPEYVAEGATVLPLLYDAIVESKRKFPTKEIYVIGGKALLEEAARLATAAYVSRIGVHTEVTDTCVLAPVLPEHHVTKTLNIFEGDDKYPSLSVDFISFDLSLNTNLK